MKHTARRPMNTTVIVTAFAAIAATTGAYAAELTSQTVEAWTTYIEATEQRWRTDQGANRGFLVQDVDGGARAWESLRRGDVLVSEMETRDSTDAGIDIPKGAVHHWRGHIFIPDVLLDDVLRDVNRPLTRHELQEDVLESRVLERLADGSKVFLKLRRKKFVTVHYNTEHDVRYTRHDALRASSQSVATRIAELKDADTPKEEERPIGHDRGFLWRLNSYWRYEEMDGGVLVECESVSLSRSIPTVVRWMVTPLVLSAARESMERTLTSLRDRVRPGDGRPTETPLR